MSWDKCSEEEKKKDCTSSLICLLIYEQVSLSPAKFFFTKKEGEKHFIKNIEHFTNFASPSCAGMGIIF